MLTLIDERNFERPLEFLPSRWTAEPHLVKNKAVFVPFMAGNCIPTKPFVADLAGPYSCAGKQLALMELRSVTAAILQRYNVALGPGQSKEGFVDGLRDTFTLVTPPLPLIFSPRKIV